MRHATLAVLLAFVSIAGCSLGATTKPLTIAVSNETAPSGGAAQIKFFAGHPQQIGSGELSIDLDPGFFSSIRSVAVFSTAGDAYGFATVTGLHADVHFGSLTGGIGQSSGLPILTVTASVSAPGHSATVTADPTGSAWRDPAGSVYSVAVTPGTVSAGGTLSISDVEPGGGVLPAGTAIQISGTGFGSSTTVEIDAASVASLQVVGPQQIQLTLGAPTELTGKRIRVRNPDGSEADYFPSLPSSPGPWVNSESGQLGECSIQSHRAGSVIQIYATGEGQTNPPGKTGSIASGENSPVLPVRVTIGGIDAQVSY
ncbi:MAG TPA: hypothetical protein VMH81_36945, partial [Bryobacteraceae bacterium]|nr:hypothetical protein [Bryobacteraceae bacterium]